MERLQDDGGRNVYRMMAEGMVYRGLVEGMFTG
jgi:hypothetical protein